MRSGALCAARAVFHQRSLARVARRRSRARQPARSPRKLATRKQGTAPGSRRDGPLDQQSALLWRRRMARGAHEREMTGQRVENLCRSARESGSQSSAAYKRAGPPAAAVGQRGGSCCSWEGPQAGLWGENPIAPSSSYHRHLLPKAEKPSTVPPWSLGSRWGRPGSAAGGRGHT